MLKGYRKDLHRIPEIGFNEFKTSEYIYNIVKDYNCKILRSNTAIILFFDYGYDYSIAFRADMDALPIVEDTTLEYKSINGFMHACGHDGHMAMLLGLAHYLNNNKQDKNVVLIFQPSEELAGGAQSVVDLDIFNKYNIKSLFGMHIWPNLKDNTIYSRPKELMAKSSEVTITIKGKSAHAASANQGIDALECASYFLTSMYDYERSIDKSIYRLLKFGKMNSGVIRNVISDLTVIEATLRAYSDDVYYDLINKMKEVSKNLMQKYNAVIEIDIVEGYPPVINNTALFSKVINLIDINVLEKPVMQAEDFGVYCSIVPCVFFFLGSSSTISLHNSKFDFNTDILEYGLSTFKKLLEIKL